MKPRAAFAPQRNLERARTALQAKRNQKPMSGPFGADSLRGIAYKLLTERPMTTEQLMEETGWSLKVTRETLATSNASRHVRVGTPPTRTRAAIGSPCLWM